MKPNCYFKSAELPLTIFLLFILLSSCTVYQNVPDNDGIYTKEIKRTRVIVENSKEYDEYENNYFTKELERLDGINGTDILTDIETYSSVDDNTNNSSETNEGYMINNAWGYSDSDQIVINLDLRSAGFGWDNYLNFHNPYFNYGYFPPWNRRAWRLGWRYGIGNYSFWPGYGYFHSPFFNPFFNNMSGYRFFNWRNYYGNGYTNNGFRNYNYGKRNYSYNSSNTRNYTNSRRINSSKRRVHFTNGRAKNTANDINNIDNLASRLRLDKSKIKVYNKPKNVPVNNRQFKSTRRKNTSVRSNNPTKRSNYKVKSSRNNSNYSPKTRSSNSSRSSSIRNNSSRRSSSTRSSATSSRSSSSKSIGSSRSSSSKKGG